MDGFSPTPQPRQYCKTGMAVYVRQLYVLAYDYIYPNSPSVLLVEQIIFNDQIKLKRFWFLILPPEIVSFCPDSVTTDHCRGEAEIPPEFPAN